jgi:hypothetical protein
LATEPNNFADVRAIVELLRADLVSTKKVIKEMIDDLQDEGLLA